MVDGVIVLYEQNETDFTSNGLGYLSDVTECTVSEELNGEYELEMEYPVDGIRYSEIQHRRILYVKPNPYEDPQPFRIYNINRPIDGRVEINARHISYDLSGYTVSESKDKHIPFSTSPKMFCEKIPSAMTELNSGMPPFTFWTNSVEEYDSETYAEEGDGLKEKHWIFIDTPSSVRSLIGQFTEKYKGEFKFDKYAVKFYGPISGQSEDDKHYRGTDSGVVLRYGKNLTDLMQEEDSDKGMYTHLYPYWSGTVNTTKTETDSESDESSSSTTTTYSSNSEEKVVTMTNKLYPIFDHDVGYKRVLIYEVNSDWNEKHPNNTNDATPWPSEEDFEELCKEYIKNNELGAPKITLTASFVQLSRSAEYEDLKPLEKVLLGDTVSVLWEDLGVNSALKCTRTEYDALTDSYKSITLGNDANASISSTVAATSSGLSGVSSSMSDKVSKEEFYNQTYDTALSTTSTNAVQNKVVTSKFSMVDKTCNGFKSEIANILEIIENLNPSGGGSTTTYGFNAPSGGNNGDAYVQLKSETIEPVPTVSVSATSKRNLEISNFVRSRQTGLYSFNVSGTTGSTSSTDPNYDHADLNVTGLISGAEYEVSFDMQHDISNGYAWRRFGMQVSHDIDTCIDTGIGSYYNAFTDNTPYERITKWYYPSIEHQNFCRKNNRVEHYAFTFKSTTNSACLNIVSKWYVSQGTTIALDFTNFKIKYLGTPIVPKTVQSSTEYQTVGSISGDYCTDLGYAVDFDSFKHPSAMEIDNCITGSAFYRSYGWWQFTFNDQQKIDYMELALGKASGNYDENWPLTNREYRVEGSVDGTNFVTITTDHQTIHDTSGVYSQTYYGYKIDSAIYKAIRIQPAGNTENGDILEFQVYRQDAIVPIVSIKDLYFKIDGSWMKYPKSEVTIEPIETSGVEIAEATIDGTAVGLYSLGLTTGTQELDDGITPLPANTIYAVYETT